MKESVILVSAAALAALGMLVIASILILVPLFTISALNILFPVLEIPYTIQTWASVVILTFILNLRFVTKG